jgi:hypothetical protein
VTTLEVAGASQTCRVRKDPCAPARRQSSKKVTGGEDAGPVHPTLLDDPSSPLWVILNRSGGESEGEWKGEGG